MNLANRRADTRVQHIADLRDVIGTVDAAHPFSVVAIVVQRYVEWPHSTLHAYIARGMAAPDWGGGAADDARWLK